MFPEACRFVGIVGQLIFDEVVHFMGWLNDELPPEHPSVSQAPPTLSPTPQMEQILDLVTQLSKQPRTEGGESATDKAKKKASVEAPYNFEQWLPLSEDSPKYLRFKAEIESWRREASASCPPEKTP